MYTYPRSPYYYETDQMSIVHHSNYVRWLEEARMAFLHDEGLDYAEMERLGVIMPVTSVECRYKSSVRFGDRVFIHVFLAAYNGVRLSFSYEIRNEDGTLMAEGSSGHCFLDKATQHPIQLKRRLPDWSARIEALLAAQE